MAAGGSRFPAFTPIDQDRSEAADSILPLVLRYNAAMHPSHRAKSDRLLTIPQMAARLGVCASIVRRTWIDTRLLPHFRLSPRILSRNEPSEKPGTIPS